MRRTVTKAVLIVGLFAAIWLGVSLATPSDCRAWNLFACHGPARK